MSEVFLLKRGKIIFQVLPSCHYQQAGFLGQNYSACMKRWLRDEGKKYQNPKKEPLNHTATKLSSSQGLAEENVQNQLPGETFTAGLCAFCCCCFPSHHCRGYRLLDCSWHSNITRRCIWTDHRGRNASEEDNNRHQDNFAHWCSSDQESKACGEDKGLKRGLY